MNLTTVKKISLLCLLSLVNLPFALAEKATISANDCSLGELHGEIKFSYDKAFLDSGEKSADRSVSLSVDTDHIGETLYEYSGIIFDPMQPTSGKSGFQAILEVTSAFGEGKELIGEFFVLSVSIEGEGGPLITKFQSLNHLVLEDGVEVPLKIVDEEKPVQCTELF